METRLGNRPEGHASSSITRFEALLVFIGPSCAMVSVWVIWYLFFSHGPSILSDYYHPLLALTRQCADYPTCPFPAPAIATLYVAQTAIILLSLLGLTVFFWMRLDYRRTIFPHWLITVFWIISLMDFFFGLFDSGAKRSSSNSIAHSPLGAFHFALDYSLCWLFTLVVIFAKLSQTGALSLKTVHPQRTAGL